MRRFQKGDLVKIDILRTATSHGLLTARAVDDDKLKFSEIIDLETYPSCYDFRGNTVICDDKETGTVITYIGRPWQIRPSGLFEEYDVYEVLIKETTCHIFSNNLVHATDKDS